MKLIMVMFDSLNRRMLAPYNCDWTCTPNFQRLAERAVTFENAYVGSMPCMPARRELHTGRYNFLHCGWSPLQPFDDSMPEILKNRGVFSHLISDHYHYWEDGGATYHTRYSSWEISRGQEGDPWKCEAAEPEWPEAIGQHSRRDSKWIRQDVINRKYTQGAGHPQHLTFDLGLEFLQANHAQDGWFLQIETFDPHEPYFCDPKFLELYPHEYAGPHFDWPFYRHAQETPEQVRHLRYVNAALHSQCDASLGRVLDFMDAHDLWEDTMLIVNTDHGFLLGEHEWFGKCAMPFYDEIAHTPLFIWDPRNPGASGQRRRSLVQTIDLAPTILDVFGMALPPDMQGKPLRGTIAADTPVREAGLFGVHGGHVNITDGRYVYMRAPVNPDNAPLFNYTLMPTHMRGMFRLDELKDAELAEPFSFTKGLRTLKTPAQAWTRQHEFETMLFDLSTDPGQLHPITDPAAEDYMISHMVRLMRENDAPVEQYERLGLTSYL